MAKTMMTFRLDAELKEEFSNLCSEMGITMSMAITMFMRKAVSEQGIPFDISKSNKENDL